MSSQLKNTGANNCSNMVTAPPSRHGALGSGQQMSRSARRRIAAILRIAFRILSMGEKRAIGSLGKGAAVAAALAAMGITSHATIARAVMGRVDVPLCPNCGRPIALLAAAQRQFAQVRVRVAQFGSRGALAAAVLGALAAGTVTPGEALAGPGIFINDGTDNGCLWTYDTAGASQMGNYSGTINPSTTSSQALIANSAPVVPTNANLGGNANTQCSTGDKATQTTRTLFYGPQAGTGANSLTLGNELYVNGGNLGLGGGTATGALRIGSTATLGGISGTAGIAIGGGASATNASGNNSIAIGTGANATQTNAAALGQGATSSGMASLALGSGDPNPAVTGGTAAAAPLAAGARAIAVGPGASAASTYAIAIGNTASATSQDSFAIGDGAQAKNTFAVALGTFTSAAGANSIAMGTSASAQADNSIALGTNAVAKGGKATSIGFGNTAFGDGAVAIGDPSYVSGTGAFAGGANNIANNDGTATATATNAANGAVAIGNNNVAIGQGSVALGNNSKAGAAGKAGSVAIGDGATATANANDVALGSHSQTAVAVGTTGATIGGKAYTFAGATPASTVSVGDVGSERTITNVAAGRLSGTSTDAVNGSQLFATNQQIGQNTTDIATNTTNINGLKTDALQWNPTLNGGTGAYDASHGGGSPQTITKVANGVAPSDAVNFSQLTNATATVTTKGMDFTGNDAAAGVVHRDLGQTLTIQGGASTAGTYSGGNVKTVTDPVTGALNVQIADAPKFGVVTINDGGTGKITGLTAGTAATDAVNVSQLQAASGNAVQYDDSTQNTVTLGGAGRGHAPVTITNVAPGTLTSTSTDAVNGSQLFQTNTDVTSLGNTVTNVANNLGGGATYDPATNTYTPPTYNVIGGAVTSVGAAIINIITNSPVQYSDSNGVANPTAPSQDITLVGSGPGPVTVHNVNTGVADTDAVNVSQLNAQKTHYYSTNSTVTGGGSNFNNDGATGVNSLAAGVGASSRGDSSTTVGPFSSANGLNSLAIGVNASAQEVNGLAIGPWAASSGPGGIAIGEYSVANGESDVYIGGAAGTAGAVTNFRNAGFGERAGSKVTGSDNTALGGTSGNNVIGVANFAGGAYSGSNVTGNYNVAVGGVGSACDSGGGGNNGGGSGGNSLMNCGPESNAAGVNVTGNRNIAMGNMAGIGIAADDTVALGTQAIASANSGVAIGKSARANTAGAIAIGQTAIGDGGKAVSIGVGNTAYGDGAVAIGNANEAIGQGSMAVGNNSTAGAAGIAGNVALGDGATAATSAGDVALGSGSVTAAPAGPAYNPGAATLAGTTPTSVVSVGAPDAERQIQNVAAGSAVTDAVNVSQLRSLATSVAAGQTHYYSVNDGGIQGANYNNNGATGANSLAAGVGASSSAAGGVAIGVGAQSNVSSTIAIGSNAGANYIGGGYDTIVGTNAGFNATNIFPDQFEGATLIGTQAGQGATLGERDLFVGYAAGRGSSIGAPSNGDAGYNVGIGGSFVNSIGNWNTAIGGVNIGSNAVGSNNLSLGGSQTGQFVKGDANVSLGSEAGMNVTGSSNIAIGSESGLLFSTGTGAGTGATGSNNIALGASSGQNIAADNTIAIGQSANAATTSAIALGTGASAGGGKAVSIGAGNTAYGDGAVAIGDPSYVSGIGAFTGGANNVANSDGTLTATANNMANGAVAIGNNNKAIGQGSVALGNGSMALAGGALAFGDTAIANRAGDVALGSGSMTAAANPTSSATINGVTFGGFAGTGPISVVSVGGVGSERQITNVAAGQVTVASTDAINGSQLYSVADTLTTNINTAADKWVIGNPTTYAAPVATGVGATAIGSGAHAGIANSVALGDRSIANVAATPVAGATLFGTAYTFVGAAPAGTVSVGAPGAERQIQNVAAGQVTPTSTDAINGSQLFATNSAISQVGTTVNNLGDQISNSLGGGSTYDPITNTFTGPTYNVIGGPVTNVGDAITNIISKSPVQYSDTNGVANPTVPSQDVTLVGAADGPVTVHNVAPGVAGTDAVNVDQLGKTVAAGQTHYYVVNDDGTASGNYNNDGATGTNALAAGTNALAAGTSATAVGDGATASGGGATATGFQASASGTASSAYGQNAAASGDYSTALGYGATATQTNTVAIGNGATVTAIESVAIGRDATAAGQGQVSIGTAAGLGSTAAGNFANVAIGYVAGNNQSGGGLTSIGYEAGDGASGRDSAFIGSLAGWNSSGSNNYAFGSGAGQYTLGNGNLAFGTNAGPGGGATTNDSIAIGAFSTPYAGTSRATAIGWGANAEATDSLAVGTRTYATLDGSIALGSGSVASTAAGVAGYAPSGADATGINATTSSLAAISIGSSGNTRQITNVAAGTVDTDAVNVSQLKALDASVVAGQTHYYSVNSTVTGAGSNFNNDGATGSNALAAGVNASATGDFSTAIGNNANASGGGAIAIGWTDGSGNMGAVADGSVTIGSAATAVAGATDAVALGHNAVANNELDVALGAGSITEAAIGTSGGTIAGTAYTYAGTNPLSTVSFGSLDNERTITNVAAGRISGTSTDAINGSQLFATNAAIDNLSKTLTQGQTHYYSVNDGGAVTGNLNNDGATGINTVAAGTNATAAGISATAVGDTAAASGDNSAAFGSKAIASADSSAAFGNAAMATANGSTAFGAGANASIADSVAIGSNSFATAATDVPTGVVSGKTYNYAGGTPFSVVSVGSAGKERQIQNVAAGRISASSTDAINGSQLFATNEAINDLQTTVNNGATHYYSVNDGGVQGGNYANNGATGNNAIAAGVGASASGAGASAVGNNADASGAGSVAVGQGATASADNSVALGANSKTAAAVSTLSGTVGGQTYNFAGGTATGTVSVGDVGSERTVTNVAAGRISDTSTDAVNGSQLNATNQAVDNIENSVTNIGTTVKNGVQYDTDSSGNRTNSVTLVGGDTNSPVVIHNVAAGTANTDAVNVGQLNQTAATTLSSANNYTDNSSAAAIQSANSYTDNKFNQLNSSIGDVRSEARQAAAIGLAAASLRYDDRPGKFSAAVGGGAWKGEGAVAFGAGYTSEDGRLRTNVSGTVAGGSVGVGAGLSYTFN